MQITRSEILFFPVSWGTGRKFPSNAGKTADHIAYWNAEDGTILIQPGHTDCRQSEAGGRQSDYLVIYFSVRPKDARIDFQAPVNLMKSASAFVKTIFQNLEASQDVPNYQIQAVLELFIGQFLEPGEHLFPEFTEFVSMNIESELTIVEIAHQLGITGEMLRKRVLQEFGVQPSAYIRREKLLHARQLPVATNSTVEETAHHIGYADRYAFSRAFKAEEGISPVQFRECSG